MSRRSTAKPTDLAPATAEALLALQPGDLVTTRSRWSRNSRTMRVTEVWQAREGSNHWYLSGNMTTRGGLINSKTTHRAVWVTADAADLIAVVPVRELVVTATYYDGRPLRVERTASR